MKIRFTAPVAAGRSASVRGARPGAGMVLAALLAGCGGGGGGSAASGTASSADTRLVRLAAEKSRVALAAGSARFSLARVPAPGERLACELPDASTSNCWLDGTTGHLDYTGLGFGSHAVKITLFAADGTVLGADSGTLARQSAEVVVYGATPGGIAAALAAARAGRKVTLVEPGSHVGGMMSGGLTKTDIGPDGLDVIGGIAREVLDATYSLEVSRGRCSSRLKCDGKTDFEPQVAEAVFERLVAAEPNLAVERAAPMAGVLREGTTLVALETPRGRVRGSVFIDATYEGDLMAAAGVSHAVGREARVDAPAGDSAALALQEDSAGATEPIRPLGRTVDPYVTPGDPASGTLPFIEPKPARIPPAGTGDGRVMAYTYRLCVTDDPVGRVPFTRPADYDARRFEASARMALALAAEGVALDEAMFRPYRTVHSATTGYFKYDLNGGTTFSIDMTAPDMNQAWTTADAAGRARIEAAYRSYITGLLWTWQTDARFGPLNAKVARFGLCKDEFADNGYWPHQLYVRESRRMRGEYVLNENDVRKNGRRPVVTDVIGMGSYDFDSHAVRYFVQSLLSPERGRRMDTLVAEGQVHELLPNGPYPVPWRSLLPRAGEATNLLVVGTPSVSQVAMRSLRIEPTFMILGQSAGIGAAEALRTGTGLHALPYETLRPLLVAAGQRLSWR